MQKRLLPLAGTSLALIFGVMVCSGCNRAAREEALRAKVRAAEKTAQRAESEREALEAKLQTGKAEAPKTRKVQRFGSVVGLKPEKENEYVKLHANTWPEVLETIKKCNIRNYSIYLAKLEGKLYLFSYFEYTGGDWDADTRKMKNDPKTNEWWGLTDPCQTRLPDTPEGQQWLRIEEVFHTE